MIEINDLVKFNFYPQIKKSFLEMLKNKILIEFGSVRKFALKNNLNDTFLREALKSKENPSFKYWLELCDLLFIDRNIMFDSIVQIRTKRRDRAILKASSFPINPSPDLASLVGHAMGDGNIDEEIMYFVYTNKSIELHEVVSRIAFAFGEKKYSERYNKATDRSYSKLLATILFLAGAPNGNKIKKDFQIPYWIMNGNTEIKKAFLRAMFDDEGSVKIKSREVLFKMSKNISHLDSLQLFFNQIATLLAGLNITVTSIKKGNILRNGKNGVTVQLVLGIHSYNNFVNFYNEIGFDNLEKRKQLGDMIISYSKHPLRKYVGRQLIYKYLLMPKTIDNLSEELSLSKMAVYKHLIKLENKDLVKQTKRYRMLSLWRRLQ